MRRRRADEKPDPKRDHVRAERERCHLWLMIVAKGIGAELSGCYDPEDAQNLIDRVNIELAEAVAASKAADEAYRPYWSRVTIRKRGTKKNPKANKEST